MDTYVKLPAQISSFRESENSPLSPVIPDTIGMGSQVVTTVHLSTADSPYSIAFKSRPLYETRDSVTYFSPGVIKFQANRNSDEGWQIIGVIHPTMSVTSGAEIMTEIHHETLGLTRRAGIITHDSSSITADQPFTLAKALPGYGMGYHEIRPFFVIDSPESYLFNFSAS